MHSNYNFKFNKAYLSTFLVWIMLITFLAGCSKDTKIVLTTGFQEDEIFRIGDISCYSGEALCYLANIKNQYSALFGEEIWSTSQNGVTLGENIKDIVLGRLMKIKIMQLMAENMGISLSDEEIERAKNAAKEYYDSLSEPERAAMDDISQELLVNMYMQYALAEKTYNSIIPSVNSEISDDEARTVIVKRMVFSNLDDADEMHAQLDEGADFCNLLLTDFSDCNDSYYYRKGELQENIEDVVFSLSEGTYSNVVTDGTCYYIFYCECSNDIEKTDVTKQEILRERQQQLFEAEYQSFAADKESYLNEDLWEDIDYNADVINGTMGFFDIYDKYFQQ